MRLPEVRDAMHDLAQKIGDAGLGDYATRLAELAEETRRRSPLRVARASAKAVTDEVKEAVRATARAHPDWSNRRIGRYCKVDGGRVSEILRGHRT